MLALWLGMPEDREMSTAIQEPVSPSGGHAHLCPEAPASCPARGTHHGHTRLGTAQQASVWNRAGPAAQMSYPYKVVGHESWDLTEGDTHPPHNRGSRAQTGC